MTTQITTRLKRAIAPAERVADLLDQSASEIQQLNISLTAVRRLADRYRAERDAASKRLWAVQRQLETALRELESIKGERV